MTDTQDAGAGERPRWEWAGFDVFRYGKGTELIGGLEMANVANALEDRVQAAEQQLREATEAGSIMEKCLWSIVNDGGPPGFSAVGDRAREALELAALTASPAQPTEVEG